jgi:hypothetical protein
MKKRPIERRSAPDVSSQVITDNFMLYRNRSFSQFLGCSAQAPLSHGRKSRKNSLKRVSPKAGYAPQSFTHGLTG